MTSTEPKKEWEKGEVVISPRPEGKRTQALSYFLAVGMLGKAIVYSTTRGDFLSPKAVENLLTSRDEALIELVNALEVGKPNSESEMGVYEIKKAWLEETKKALLEAIRSSREG